MGNKKNKAKKRKAQQVGPLQNRNGNIKIEFSPEILIEVAFALPQKQNITADLITADILLHNIYSKAPFLLSWSGTELVGRLKYIFANYPFNEDEIIRVLGILEDKRQRYHRQEIASNVSNNKLGYRRSIPRVENYNGSPIIYISMHE